MARKMMKSFVEKRSVLIEGRKTSVSLEEPFWNVLKEIVGTRGVPVGVLVAEINKDRAETNLSSAIRVYVLNHLINSARG
jgi:predicted DNA-binding ribbon-helix-helix protein